MFKTLSSAAFVAAIATAQAPPAAEPTPVEVAPVAEEPVAEEPVAEEPAAEEPATEEPAAVEEPAAEEPVAEEPVAEEPVAEEPAKEEPAKEEATEEEPAEVQQLDDENEDVSAQFGCHIYHALHYYDISDLEKKEDYEWVDPTSGDSFFFNYCRYTANEDAEAAQNRAYRQAVDGTVIAYTDDSLLATTNSFVEDADSNVLGIQTNFATETVCAEETTYNFNS